MIVVLKSLDLGTGSLDFFTVYQSIVVIKPKLKTHNYGKKDTPTRKSIEQIMAKLKELILLQISNLDVGARNREVKEEDCTLYST